MIDIIRHHLAPNDSNNFRAKLLHPESLLVITGIFAIAIILIRGISIVNPGILGFATNIYIDALLEDTNNERIEQGLQPLKLNPALSQAAYAKAQDMFADDYWAHDAPDGTTPWKFITDAGYSYVYAGENLARDFNDSDRVVKAWMASPSHRDNMLRDEYTEIGFAVVNGNLGGEETTLVVQMFGTPKESGTKVAKAEKAMPQPIKESEVSEANTTPIVVARGEAVAVENGAVSSSVVNFHAITKQISFMFLGILLTILVIDGFLIWRKKTIRIAGHNFAHFIFLLSIVGIIYVTTRGSIL